MQWGDYLIGLLSPLITAPVVIGLAAWFGKLWASRILEKDRAKYQERIETLLADIRTRDTKELLVHRLQFEKEFEVYKELWGAALRLAKVGTHFRMLQIGPLASEDQIKEDLSTASTHFNTVVFDNRPFYAPQVYETAKTIINELSEILLTHNHLKQIDRHHDMTEAQQDKAVEMKMKIERSLDAINALLGTLCDVIRQRVWSTTISGWDRPKEREGD